MLDFPPAAFAPEKLTAPNQIFTMPEMFLTQKAL